MLVDSNIIIYAAQPEHSFLQDFIEEHAPSVSAISYVEVVGYHKLTAEDRQHFEEFFASAGVLPVSDGVIKQAAQLRQQRKMALADAIVAGTALQYQKTLITRNTGDFDWVPGLKLLNPFVSLPGSKILPGS